MPAASAKIAAPPMNCPVIMAQKQISNASDSSTVNARLPKRTSRSPVTVIAPEARDASAIFLPKRPRIKKPAMICGAAKTTQPSPSFQAMPGPDTNELTDP